MHKRNHKKKPDLMTDLSVERTLLAKQRTLLAEINVLAAFIGLTLLVIRFFIDSLFLKIIVGLSSILIITFPSYKVIKKYGSIKKEIQSIERKDGLL
ncbi:hypothetical protein HYX16_02990 [Candidatus Woesearchaeota archaeon]|nr:hypothetical protein [Candidatus Woesearchaeota archaeon]